MGFDERSETMIQKMLNQVKAAKATELDVGSVQQGLFDSAFLTKI